MGAAAHDITRRTLLAGAGGLAAGAAVAPSAAAATVRTVGVDPEARDAMEVIGRIVQDGDALTGFGYLTHIAGLPAAELAAGSEATARYTFHATATVAQRNLRPSLFAVVASGRLGIFRHPGGGASFDVPGSFAAGTQIASFDARFQNVLTVIAPWTGRGP